MPEPKSRAAAVARLLERLVNVRPDEVRALLWSFAYFFCLLCSYYILRPLRDEMGIAGGIQNLPWVFTATFVAMLAAVPAFGMVTARLPRRVFMPLVYYFFVVNIVLFYALFQTGIPRAGLARGFFVWTSVFNLFVVSVFWSFMADLYRNEQARRLFGFIAAGGSAGAIAGPALTAALATRLGPVHLLPVSAALLLAATFCIHRLLARMRADRTATREQPLGGGVLAGVRLVAGSPYLLGVCTFVLLFTTLSTFLYFEQANIVKAAYDDPGRRTTLFASIDLAVNVLTIATQVLVSGRVMSRFRLSVALGAIPVLVLGGFTLLAAAPLLVVLVVFQVVRRAGNYALTRPAREVLFTVVDTETKYKAKNFIDTVVYRGGDAASGWLFGGLRELGLSLSAMAWIAVPIAALWLANGVLLGRRHERLRSRLPR
ncbi:MAG: MFS transporter [Gammaproteobacteria bacterium]